MELQPEEAPFWMEDFLDLDDQLLITAREAEKVDMIALDAGDVTPAGAVFRLFGSAAAAPDSPWTVEDTIHVTLTFTFKPL